MEWLDLKNITYLVLKYVQSINDAFIIKYENMHVHMN